MEVEVQITYSNSDVISHELILHAINRLDALQQVLDRLKDEKRPNVESIKIVRIVR